MNKIKIICDGILLYEDVGVNDIKIGDIITLDVDYVVLNVTNNKYCEIVNVKEI